MLDTVSIRPFGKRTWEYDGFAWTISMGSTKGSYLLLRTNRLKYAERLSKSHVGIVIPGTNRLGNLNSRSCGVSFVAVHSKDRRENKTSGRTSAQKVCDFE